MRSYWMMLKSPPVSDWYVYYVDGNVYSQLDMRVREWEPKYIRIHPLESNYDQVPDSVMVLMGLPL
jgi:hypothetical protein